MRGLCDVLPWWSSLAVISLFSLASGDLTKKNHLTHRASEKPNDLSCYTCHSMDDGDRCINLPPLGDNYSIASNGGKNFVKQCKDDRRICMIKRYSYTTSTENSTSKPELWAMERNCTNKCESGCIIIGERVKLYACTACCENTLCNNGTGAAASNTPSVGFIFIANVASFIVVRRDYVGSLFKWT